MNKMFIKFNFTYVSMQSFIMIGPIIKNFLKI